MSNIMSVYDYENNKYIGLNLDHVVSIKPTVLAYTKTGYPYNSSTIQYAKAEEKEIDHFSIEVYIKDVIKNQYCIYTTKVFIPEDIDKYSGIDYILYQKELDGMILVGSLSDFNGNIGIDPTKKYTYNEFTKIIINWFISR